jgi:hypothetical protein
MERIFSTLAEMDERQHSPRRRGEEQRTIAGMLTLGGGGD